MNRKWFSPILIFLPFIIYGQNEWAPNRSIWHYSQGTTNLNLISYCTIESISDTLIDGILCKKMLEVQRNIDDTLGTGFHYMYASGDSVLFYKDNAFHLLYNFGAVSGDTVILGYYQAADGVPLKMFIDSISTIEIDGIGKKIQHITCGDGITVEFNGQIIENIGNTSYMFPTYELNNKGPLRCYTDEQNNVFINPYYADPHWNRENCEQIVIKSSFVQNYNDYISIFPSPFRNYISIRNFTHPFNFVVYNLNGIVVKQGVVKSTENSIYLQDLVNGIYFLEITNINSKIIKKIIKQ